MRAKHREILAVSQTQHGSFTEPRIQLPGKHRNQRGGARASRGVREGSEKVRDGPSSHRSMLREEEEEEELFWSASLSRCYREPRDHFLVADVTEQHGGGWKRLRQKNKE